MKRNLKLFSTFVIFVLLQLAICHAAPRKPINTYDQRQDGKTNVNAKLENFWFVIAPPSSIASAALEDLLQNSLVSQALNLKNGESTIVADANGEESQKTIVETIEMSSDEKIKENSRSDDSSDPETTITRISSREFDPENAKKVKIIGVVQRYVPVDSSTSVQSSEENLKDKNNEESVLTDLPPKTDEKSIKKARSLKNHSEGASVSKLPTSESSELTQPDNNVAIVGSNEHGNDVGSSEQQEPQELKLLGGGIENCGPERFRDRFGICRFRVDV